MEHETDMLDELEVTFVQKRSNFLTVLCILTWIGSGASILYYGYEYLVIGAFMRKGILSGNTHMSWLAIIFLVSAIAPLVTITGSILMWFLRKWGFYLYAAGQLIPVVLAFYFAIAINGVRGPSLIFSILWGVVPIGFTVMYALNLRSMK